MGLIATVRAGIWGFRAAGAVRRQLRRGGLHEVRVPPAPPVSLSAERGVSSGLALARATCLVRANVRQRWYASHGSRRALVVGVTRPSEGFQAHAWLEGDPLCHEQPYQELLRRPAL